MKILTITCHNVYNHGASLQEHALLAYLKAQGHEVRAINYRPSYESHHFSFTKVAHPFFGRNIIFRFIYRALKLPIRLYNLKRKISFDRFSKTYIPATQQLYRNNKELTKNVPEADAYICGSDQIWNSFFENGKDPAFYLNFVEDNKLKISYAASFAIDNLEPSLKPFVKTGVSRLNYISVREQSGLVILKDLGITNAKQVLDPVFLLDREYWKKLALKNEINKDYVMVYDFDSNFKIRELALELKRRNGWDIITVNQKIPYADQNHFRKGPDYFLSLIYNAKFVISNSFHAVAFSLIFEKDFLVFNRTDKINTRMRDLLQSLDLEHLLVAHDCNVANLIDLTINYKKVKPKLTKKIALSQQFLYQALNN
ncbi:polysaccharide pyruvyl transferase family protein [Lentiprolixibacter aurantiacus]|uniref:Polysaccharide pyruvyl transferase family protein n=1 Tax=Lentiprolixibacter aurantiacus TaxID=2993939 RepID=A0AAE3MN03_9FLAO|nr:polysaccharide pyruvyl transferase family protein [Lentiprolixibacter aurantiacus]MCX2719857.1 polysaccharide pyruvyl transferase family protein [Lentiprolixibacter aurantiacus]